MRKIFLPIFIQIVDILFNRIRKRFATDIQFERQARALKSTVDYVEAHMKDVTSMDSKWKVHQYALSQVSVKGLYLEFGVYKGQTINFIAKQVPQTVFGFDSFEGLPEFWRDGFDKGAFALNKLPKVVENVVLVKGYFDQSLPDFLQKYGSEPIAYLHIDCDLYSSTKTIFEHLKSNIVPGTVIVFDEYFNFPGWEEDEFRAFKEFVEENHLNYTYLAYNSLSEQVAVRIG
jgi:Macrocin-O-methyltransferase (TylF)